MENTEILSSLIEIIKPYVPEEAASVELTEDKHLIEDLKINSAHIIDIVLDIEEKFDIAIDDNAVGTMNTLGDVVKAIGAEMTS